MTDRNLKAGETVYSILRHVSKSGMLRYIDIVAIRDNQPIQALALVPDEVREQFREHYKYNPDKAGFKTSGCGMDMGFDMVYNLSRMLFPDGFKVTDDTIHRNGTPNGTTDKDGGYALNQEWL